MTIKLNGSTAGSVSLDAPASTTGNADINFKLPVADGTANQVMKTDGSGQLSFGATGNTNGMQVLEEFFVPCNGTAVTTSQGSVSIENVTTHQTASDTLTKVNGSEIDYQPPSGTKLVIYTMQIQCSYDSQNTILGFNCQLDGTSVTAMPASIRYMDYGMSLFYYQHGFRIESSADSSVGQVTSWNSPKTIRLRFRRWNSSYSGRIHFMGEGLRPADLVFDNNQFRMPSIGIRAIGAV
jgi:hypothetical protein